MSLIFFMILNSILMILFQHPLTCGMILFQQTLITALITGLMNYDFWFSYILFLIMIGGMLILFIYMTSIASNEKFKFNNKFFNFIIILIMILMLINIIDLFYLNFNNMLNLKMMIYNFDSLTSMKKYFNFPNYYIMFLLIIYLFITLIITVKMTNFSYGALRQKF